MKIILFLFIISSFLFSDRLVLSGKPFHAGKENTFYIFTPEVESEKHYVFSIQNKPYWAYFDLKTGKLSGTPDFGDIGLYKDINISVSSENNSSSIIFDLEILPFEKEEESYLWYKVIGLILTISFALSVMF